MATCAMVALWLFSAFDSRSLSPMAGSGGV